MLIPNANGDNGSKPAGDGRTLAIRAWQTNQVSQRVDVGDLKNCVAGKPLVELSVQRYRRDCFWIEPASEIPSELRDQ